MILVSPTEPSVFQAIGKTSSLPEQYGVDFLCPTSSGLAGVQRKQFPEDFLSSVRDGRLHRELPMMLSIPNCLLILEGRGVWTSEGNLANPRLGGFSRVQLLGILLSIQITHKIPYLWTDRKEETITSIVSFFSWCDKSCHTGLSTRPGPGREADDTAWKLHFLQGIPGVGATTAERILEEYGRLPFDLIPEVLNGGLEKIDKIGPKKSKRILEFFK
jgi:ERCC4-type nuclease